MFTPAGHKLIAALVEELKKSSPTQLDTAFAGLKNSGYNLRYIEGSQQAKVFLSCVTEALEKLLAIHTNWAHLNATQIQTQIGEIQSSLNRTLDIPFMVTEQLEVALTEINTALTHFDSHKHLVDSAHKGINAGLNGLTIIGYGSARFSNLFTTHHSPLITITPVVKKYQVMIADLLAQIEQHKKEVVDEDVYTQVTISVPKPDPENKNQNHFEIMPIAVRYSARKLFPDLEMSNGAGHKAGM